jgi:TRAP transporter 4TM/12TM fusion protein
VRVLDVISKRIITVLAVVVALIQMYTSGFGVFPALIQRPLHLLFILPMALLTLPVSKKIKKEKTLVFDLALAILAIGVTLYSLIYANEMAYRVAWPKTIDLMMGSILIVLVLEATRRAVGSALFIIGSCTIAYALFGNTMPGLLAHVGFDLERVISYLYITTEGIYGIPLYVFTTFVFAFIIFGTFLEKSGAGNFFVDLAFALTGKFRGGPAKAAVVSSALMGMISGSSQANVATTGTFTIPLMKKIGYDPPLAGAIEAVASTGGLFTPPIMASAAFLMAEFIGIPYIEIAAAAIIPAIIYYITVFLIVDIEATKSNVLKMETKDIPKLGAVLKKGWHFLMPVVVIIVLLVVMKSSPMKAAFWATVTSVFVSMFRAETRMSLKKILQTLETAGKRAISLGMACASAGIIVGMLSMTALAIRVTYAVVSSSADMLGLALILTMFTAIVLGMGLPAAATYIILAVMAAPILVEMGLSPLLAHFFVFYFSSLAPITPPVCMSSFVAASIADADPMKTGFIAFKYAFPAFIVPYAFAFGGEALLGRGEPLFIAIVVCTAIIGAASFAFAATGWLSRPLSIPLRIGFLITAVLMIVPGILSDVFGFAILATCLAIVFLFNKHQVASHKEA